MTHFRHRGRCCFAIHTLRGSIDPFIDARREVGRQRQSELGKCRATDAQGELRRPCDRQVSRICATENPVHVSGGTVIAFVVTRTKRHKPASQDIFHVAVHDRQSVFCRPSRKGEAWILECEAERIESPARPVLSVQGAEGHPVVEAGAAAGGDARLSFTAPADGYYTVTLRDLHGSVRGGPNLIYRLALRPDRPDFGLSLSQDHIDVAPAGKARTNCSGSMV